MLLVFVARSVPGRQRVGGDGECRAEQQADAGDGVGDDPAEDLGRCVDARRPDPAPDVADVVQLEHGVGAVDVPEGQRVGWAASGRNGGFCESSLTHGEENGRNRWPDEFDTLERLGLDNLDAIQETVERYAAATGLRPANLDWLYAYNLFRLAAICQGIAGRVRDGTAASAHAKTMAAQVGPLSDAAWAFAKTAGA